MPQKQSIRSRETLIDWLSQHGLENLHDTLVAEDFTKVPLCPCVMCRRSIIIVTLVSTRMFAEVEHLLDLDPADISNLRFIIPELKGEGRAGREQRNVGCSL